MPTEQDAAKHRISLDGEWGLLEFSGFGRQYLQTYAAIYALANLPTEDELSADERVEYAFRAFPWKGGWSSVDFFSTLRYSVPKKYQPRVVEIEYASPGHIDLLLVVSVALVISRSVKHIADHIDRFNTVYNNIQKGIRERKLGKIDVRRAELQLKREEQQFVEESINRLQELMKIDEVQQIELMSPSKLGTLKILSALYRRLRDLAKLQAQGKIKF